VLPVNEVATAAKHLCAGQEDMMTASSLLMGNINRLQYKGGKAEALVRKLEELTDEVENLQGECYRQKVKVAGLRGELEQALAMEKVFAASAGQKQAILDALNVELKGIEEKLRKSEQQEHDYTFRCYGPFSWVWENDVKLAKEKVHRYQQQAVQMKAQIAAASSAAGDTDLARQQAEVTKKRVESEEQLKVDEDVVSKQQEKIKLGEKTIAVVQTKLELFLKREGKESSQELFDAMAALSILGTSSVSANNNNEVMVSGWVKDLNFMGMSLSWMARKCKTIEQQRRCLTTIREWAEKDDNKLAKFMKQVPPIMDLTSLYSFEDTKNNSSKRRKITTSVEELSDEELAQIVAELKEPVRVPEINRAVVEQRVVAITDGSEPSAAGVIAAAGETTQVEEIPAHATSDDITFVDAMAGDFD